MPVMEPECAHKPSPLPLAAGCLAWVAGAVTGFASWVRGAGPGVRGGFEGVGQDFSLLYLELPVMLFGVPLCALVALAMTRRALPVGVGRTTRAATATAVVLVVLAVLARLCLVWLEYRLHPALQGDGPESI